MASDCNFKFSLQRRLTWALIAIFGLCLCAYLQGLFGGFEFDDFWNIVDNGSLRKVDGTTYSWLVAAFSSNSGLLHRPVSMLSFALNIYWFGMSPLAFKLVNLVIHLLNGWLIYRLSLSLAPRLLTSADQTESGHSWIAVLVTGAWLLHPLHVSGVLYIVQRMNELSTLFILAGLVCYVEGRQRLIHDKPGVAISILGLITFGILAVFSKENGALITAYAFVIEAICFRFESNSPRTSALLKRFFLLSVLLPCLGFLIFITLDPSWLVHKYASRNFTLAQRLLTEPRILFHYLLWIFVPWPSWMGLYHDDIPLSTQLLNPFSTVFVILTWVALVACAVKQRHRSPGFIFAVIWFLVGHSMESTVLPLELVFEHRNYLPMYGLFLGGITAVTPLVSNRLSKTMIGGGAAVLLLALAASTAVRAYSWSDPLRLAHAETSNHPNSTRSQYDYGRAMILSGAAKGQQHPAEILARPYFLRSMELDSTNVYPSTGYLLTLAGQEIIPKSVVDDLAYRLRNAPIFPPEPFLAVINAATEAKLSLTPNQVSDLVSAALDNPSATPEMRAVILNDYGRYRFEILHDAQGDVSLTLAAAELDPTNPFFQVNLAQIALGFNQTDIAAKHLAAAEKLDTASLYVKDIKSLHDQIEKQENSTSSKTLEKR